MSEGDGSLIEFPTSFPIKVMGAADARFEALVRGLVHEVLAPERLEDMRERGSRGGRYVSWTVTVRVESKQELDAVYRALTAHDDVLMVL